MWHEAVRRSPQDPSALVGLFWLGPLTVWPIRNARLVRPQIKSTIYLASGVAVGLVLWRLANMGHYQQEGFLEYVEQAFLFWIYWGASITGNLREGMQSWVLALIAVIALQQWDGGFPWFRSILARLAITLRAVEVLAVAVGATLATHSFNPIREHFAINDGAAFGVVLLLSLALIWVVWRGTRPDAAATRSSRAASSAPRRRRGDRRAR